MNPRQAIVLGSAIALIAGCSHNMSNHHPATRPMAQAAQQNASSEDTAEQTATAPAPGVGTDKLAGAWQLAMPRHQQRQATITATDATHVTIDAGDNLSGNYVVQGKYLLILTHDQRLRPLAW